MTESDAVFTKPACVKASSLFAKDSPVCYVVPAYQRHFVWKQPHIERVLSSLLAESSWYKVDDVNSLSPKFYGCLVFWTADSGHEKHIVDGQQRVTTLTILLAVLRDILRKDGLEGPAAMVEEHLFLPGGFNLTNRKVRLRSQQEDAAILERIVRGEGGALCDGEEDSPLGKAYGFALTYLLDHLTMPKKAGIELSTEEMIGRIYQRIVFGAEFVVLLANNEVNAFSLFESLNTPGQPLNAADRLKNKLLAMSGKKSAVDFFADIGALWQKLEQLLGRSEVEPFLHVYWRAFHGYVPRTDLYDKLKEHVETNCKGAGQVKAFLEQLIQDAKLYAKSYDAVAQMNLSKTHRMSYKVQNAFGARTARPCLLWVEKHAPSQVERTLRTCEAIAVRQILCEKKPQAFNKKYTDLLDKLRSGAVKDIPSELQTLFKDIVPTDAEFGAALRKWQCFRTTAKLQWMLRRLNDAYGASEHDLSTESVWVEHVFSRNASEAAKKEAGFAGSSEADCKRYVSRLGNVTLLLEQLNNAAKNKPFSIKRQKYYSQCDLKITRDTLLEPSTWNAGQIDARTDALVEKACKFWAV